MSTGLGEVRIVNDTDYRFRQLAMCGMVFPQGQVLMRGDGIAVDRSGVLPIGLAGYQSAVTAETAWPDGSVRIGRLLAVPRIAPHLDENVVVTALQQEEPFKFGAWAGLAAAINPRLTIVRADGSRIVSALSLTGGKNLAVTSTGIVSIVKQRIPGTCLWWSIRTMVGSDCDVIPFRLRIHNSDPTRAGVREDWAAIHFDSDIAGHFLLWRKLGLTPTTAPGIFGPAASFSWKLSGPDWMADGQGFWDFDGVFPLIDPTIHPVDEVERVEALQASVTWIPLMQHSNWREPGMFGPFGNPGELPQGKPLAQAESEITSRANGFRTIGTEIARWGDWDFAEAPDTAQTGEHETHGTALLAAQILSNNPRAQAELMFASLGESRRPMHRYEANLEVVRKRDHPNLIYWSGNVQWTSQDKLGKGTAQATDTDKHLWSGPDPEHWMPEAFIGPVAMLTMDWDLLEIMRQEMEQLKGHGYTQIGAFAERAQDWCSYAMAWARSLLPQEPDDLSFVRGWQDWMVDWWLHKNPRGEGGWGAGPGPIKPTISMKDQRYFWGPILPNGQPDQQLLPFFYIIWQHYFGWGRFALELVDPHPQLRTMIATIARWLDFHGWDDSRRHPFGGVLWQDGGQPIPNIVYVQDVFNQALQIWQKTPGTATWDVGTDWGIWAEGGRSFSGWLARLVGDTAWITRNDQIAQWIRDMATTPTARAKLARWSGSLPVAPTT